MFVGKGLTLKLPCSQHVNRWLMFESCEYCNAQKCEVSLWADTQRTAVNLCNEVKNKYKNDKATGVSVTNQKLKSSILAYIGLKKSNKVTKIEEQSLKIYYWARTWYDWITFLPHNISHTANHI